MTVNSPANTVGISRLFLFSKMNQPRPPEPDDTPTVTVTSTTTETPPAPTVVDYADIKTGGAKAAGLDGVLVQVGVNATAAGVLVTKDLWDPSDANGFSTRIIAP